MPHPACVHIDVRSHSLCGRGDGHPWFLRKFADVAELNEELADEGSERIVRMCKICVQMFRGKSRRVIHHIKGRFPYGILCNNRHRSDIPTLEIYTVAQLDEVLLDYFICRNCVWALTRPGRAFHASGGVQ